MRLIISLTAVAAFVACGNDRPSTSATGGDPGAVAGGGSGGEATGEGEGGAGEAEGGAAGEGEGEGEGEGGSGGGADDCHFVPQECPEDLSKGFTYTYRTADCVTIAFDYYPAPQDGLRPVVLLLHDGIRGFRRNWEDPGVDHFIDSLRCEGYTVVNADMRGHLQSKGRHCRGWPGEHCERTGDCVTGICEEGRCADPATCDPAAEAPECPTDTLECDMWGRCLQEVDEEEEILSAQGFSAADWTMVADDVASIFEFFDVLANLENTYVYGEDGSTTEVPDELNQTDFPGLAGAFQDAGFEPNELDAELGFFVRINVEGEERNYSIRSVAGDVMTFRSDKDGDWSDDENEDAFFSTTPLTETLEKHPWLLMQRANLPFDPERFAIVAPGIGGNAALRYAGRDDSRSRATIVLSPVLAGADGLQQRHLRDLASDVSVGAVYALTGSENARGVSALEAIADPENPRVYTKQIRGVATAGIDLVSDVSVTNDIKCWMEAEFGKVPE